MKIKEVKLLLRYLKAEGMIDFNSDLISIIKLVEELFNLED